jgi:MFS transporter, ACS family, tartrate transporter
LACRGPIIAPFHSQLFNYKILRTQAKTSRTFRCLLDQKMCNRYLRSERATAAGFSAASKVTAFSKGWGGLRLMDRTVKESTDPGAPRSYCQVRSMVMPRSSKLKAAHFLNGLRSAAAPGSCRVKSTIEAVVIRKLSRRLGWFLTLLFFCCVLDRVNIGFAALSMNRELGLTARTFGVGASMFSVGYLLFEVPSNLVLHRIGARRWIARIMVTWGLVSMATVLCRGPNSFYFLRFLLGVAEAGFFPGVILYLSYWFPAAHRGRFNALFLLAIPLSQTLAAAISGALLELDGVLGVAGWRWLILIEGVPALALGVVTFFYLTDRPRDATWLDADERNWLETTLAHEDRAMNKLDSRRLFHTFTNPAVLLLGLTYFGINIILTGVPLWLPQIIRGGGYSYALTGFLAAMPPLAGAVVMVLWSRHSDRNGERLWHLLAAIALCSLGWGIAAFFANSPSLLILSLVVANAGILAATSTFWTLPANVLAGASAAAGIALIGVIGNLGGIFGPIVVGQIKDTTQTFTATFVFMSAVAVAAGIIAFAARSKITRGEMRKIALAADEAEISHADQLRAASAQPVAGPVST